MYGLPQWHVRARRFWLFIVGSQFCHSLILSMYQWLGPVVLGFVVLGFVGSQFSHSLILSFSRCTSVHVSQMPRRSKTTDESWSCNAASTKLQWWLETSWTGIQKITKMCYDSSVFSQNRNQGYGIASQKVWEPKSSDFHHFSQKYSVSTEPGISMEFPWKFHGVMELPWNFHGMSMAV